MPEPESTTAEAYQAFLEHGGALDLSHRPILQFSGEDRVRYLNGQVTNDVTHANANQSIYTCITNHKGRMDGDAWITAEGDRFLLDVDEALGESLQLRLGKYIIADDVELEEVSAEWNLWHFIGASLPELESPAFARSTTRIGIAGWDIWIPADSPVPQSFKDAAISPQTADLVRIDHGVPAWGNELSPDRLPPEARLEARAINYEKGCYIGQEVISRIRSAGKVNNLLNPLLIEGDSPSEVCGMTIWSDPADERPVGTVSSVAWHPVEEAWIALGFLKPGKLGPGQVATAGTPENKLFSQVKIRESVGFSSV